MSFASESVVGRTRALTQRALVFALTSCLLLASGTHLAVAIDHGASVFAALALGAALAQCVLAAAVLWRPSSLVYQASIFLSLMLMQLYALNITVGLPPLIAHTHHDGTHTLLGIALAMPNAVDTQGIVAQVSQLGTVFSAAFLDTSD